MRFEGLRVRVRVEGLGVRVFNPKPYSLNPKPAGVSGFRVRFANISLDMSASQAT